MGRKKEPRCLKTAESRALVTRMTEDLCKVIDRHTKNIDYRQQWLIRGRVLNLLFSSHYKLSMRVGEESFKRISGIFHEVKL